MTDTKPIEESILGCLLVYGRKALSVVPELTTESFTPGEAREVFQACLRMQQDDMETNLVTVAAELKGRISASRLSEMTDVAVGTGELTSVVRQLNITRAVVHAGLMGRRVVQIADSQGLLSDRLDEISKIGVRLVGLGAIKNQEKVNIHAEEIIEEGIKLADQVLFGGEGPEPIKVGIYRVDNMVHIVPGQLVVIAGTTGSGKSSLCTQIALKAARAGQGVIFITSEMSHQEMLARFASAMTGTPVANLVDPRVAAEHGGQEDYAQLRGIPIWFQRAFPPRIEDAIAAIRTTVAEHNVKLAVVDYAQRLARSDDDRKTEQAIARIAEECKNLALELNIVVVAAAQVNRQATGRKNPKPVLEDLRGSGALEQNADCVLFTHQPSHYGLQGPPQIIVAKQRNGPTGEVEVIFDAKTCVFRSA